MFDRWGPPRPRSPGPDPGRREWRRSRSEYPRSSKHLPKGAKELTDLDTTTDGWIAVLGQWRKGQGRLPLPYVHALDLASAPSIKVLSTFEEPASEEIPADLDILAQLDPFDPTPLVGAAGLLLCGGGDVDPQLYGRRRHPRTHNVSQQRDRFELTMVGAALERDIPVLAICRGMQLLNVHLGGTLDQHVPDTPGRLDHDRDRPLGDPAHGLSIREGSLLHGAVDACRIEVNTHHHQGLDDVAPELDEIAWAEDGVLEAVVSKEHSWVLGVQWHPEAMLPMHEAQLKVFEGFVESVRAYEGFEEEVRAKTA